MTPVNDLYICPVCRLVWQPHTERPSQSQHLHGWPNMDYKPRTCTHCLHPGVPAGEIKYIRERRKMTKKQAAAEAGVTSRMIGIYEANGIDNGVNTADSHRVREWVRKQRQAEIMSA